MKQDETKKQPVDRRSFLKTAATGGAALVASATTSATASAAAHTERISVVDMSGHSSEAGPAGRRDNSKPKLRTANGPARPDSRRLPVRKEAVVRIRY